MNLWMQIVPETEQLTGGDIWWWHNAELAFSGQPGRAVITFERSII